MVQAFLGDRFRMSARRVMKDADGYLLSVAKGGLKIQPAKPGDPPPPLPGWFGKDAPSTEMDGKPVATNPDAAIGTITGRRVTRPQVAEALGRSLQTLALDEIGLAGKYYFGLRYARDERAESDVPALFTVLQNQLGLKLERHKGPIERLVVDHIEKKPTGS
jgi:uncharacterized protein (TIGR03435 family)